MQHNTVILLIAAVCAAYQSFFTPTDMPRWAKTRLLKSSNISAKRGPPSTLDELFSYISAIELDNEILFDKFSNLTLSGTYLTCQLDR